MDKGTLAIINKLHMYNINSQDLVSILYNLRPCARFGITIKNYSLLKYNLPRLNLKMEIYYYKGFNTATVLIGKNRKLLQEGIKLDTSGDNNKKSEFGKLLGYPSCCVDFLCTSKFASGDEIVMKVLDNSKTLNFLLNFLYNLDTRVKEKRICEELRTCHYSSYWKYIIPHIPCSFDCTKSILYAKKLYALLSNSFPTYAKKLHYSLNKTFLYFDNFRFVILKGCLNNNTLHYNKLINVNNLLTAKDLNLFSNGNSLKLYKGRIAVFYDDQLIGNLRKKYRVLDFSD